MSCVPSPSLWHSLYVATSLTRQQTTTTFLYRARPSPSRPESSSMSKRFETQSRTHTILNHTEVDLLQRNKCEPDPWIKPLISFFFFLFVLNEQKFNNEWWIGRPVKEDGVVGFIPSPVNLETILIRREVQARKAAKALAKYVWHVSTSFSTLGLQKSTRAHAVVCRIIL